MLLCARFVTIICDVPLHILVETSEAVTKRGIFNPLFISDHIVVESLETWDRVYDEVTVTRNGAHWVGKQGDVHDLRQ